MRSLIVPMRISVQTMHRENASQKLERVSILTAVAKKIMGSAGYTAQILLGSAEDVVRRVDVLESRRETEKN